MYREFSIRDPILEGITCSNNEKELINSPLVQRLKWVTQLSMVNQVYNGATHSRFAHSLGVMQTASEYMTRLLSGMTDEQFAEGGIKMDAKEREHYIQLARLAGLLHDIGHGPFSHSFDHTVYRQIYGIEDGGHDVARLELIKHKDIAPYIENCGVHVWELLEMWSPGSVLESGVDEIDRMFYDIIKIIVEGPLGADRMDFTRRDSYHTGMQHQGTIPASRIIHGSKLFFDNGVLRISYHAKCMNDIIRTLDGRLNLYDSVYFHKTSMAASLLIELMMELVCEPLNLVAMAKDPTEFRKLNDHKIFGMISEWKPSKYVSNGDKYYPVMDPKMERAQKLYYQLMDRHLPKTEFEVRVNNLDEPYDEQLYIDKWFPDRDPTTFAIVKTRVLSGISAGKFDKHNITFHKGNSNGYTCAELLEEEGYSTPILPYYIVRGYSLQ